MKRILNTQGKHEIYIVLAIVVPLMVIGVVWAIVNGGYAEPIAPVTPVATPAPTETTPAAFTFIDAA
ncbi:MAG TPA: hypothetical protein VNZ55_04160 [Thermomicrobiales bacterium]|nr:hypothetical protein [Thermomicrobiales bacterium]